MSMDRHELERMNQLATKVMHLEAQLAHVYHHLGLQPPPPNPMDEIGKLIASGNMIAAIARYRDVHGGGLGEAKAACDALAKQLGFA